MNPKHYYHTPVKPVSTRVSCPVCHQPVYSRAGIHPQCAVIQSDPPRPKVKKEPSDGLLGAEIKIADQPPIEIIVDPAIVAVNEAGQPILAPSGRLSPLGQKRAATGKGSWVRYIK